jgi:hypothetical protein
MNTESRKLNRPDESTDRLAAWAANGTSTCSPSNLESALFALTPAFGPNPVKWRSQQPHQFATYFPELLTALGGEAFTTHWGYSTAEKSEQPEHHAAFRSS